MSRESYEVEEFGIKHIFSIQTVYVVSIKLCCTCVIGERPFECHFCAKRFASKSNFNTHLATHAGVYINIQYIYIRIYIHIHTCLLKCRHLLRRHSFRVKSTLIWLKFPIKDSDFFSNFAEFLNPIKKAFLLSNRVSDTFFRALTQILRLVILIRDGKKFISRVL